MSYQNKYLKYKSKYLELKKQVGGTHLNIPEGTTSIEYDAFSNRQLTSVTIPHLSLALDVVLSVTITLQVLPSPNLSLVLEQVLSLTIS
jgi:hypothetical protein